jgi:hypothetical protein
MLENNGLRATGPNNYIRAFSYVRPYSVGIASLSDAAGLLQCQAVQTANPRVNLPRFGVGAVVENAIGNVNQPVRTVDDQIVVSARAPDIDVVNGCQWELTRWNRGAVIYKYIE